MTLASAKKTLAGIASRVDAIVAEGYTLRISLAVELSEAFTLFQSVPKLGTWRNWAEEHCPDESPQSLYRLKDAGTVARILGESRGASDRTLQLLHRFRANGTADEVAASEDKIRALWAEACKGKRNGKAPTEAEVAAIVNRESPQGGKRGKGGGRKPRTTSKPRKPAGTAEAPPETDEAAIRAASGEVSRYLGRIVKDAADRPAIVALMLATVKLCETHGVTTMYAVLAAEKKNGAK
jgi:hypothetical protein